MSMSKNDSVSEVDVPVKKSNRVWKSILIVVLFLVIGIAIGYYGASRYLELKEKEQEPEEEVLDVGPLDITNSEEYKELITSLYAVINGNTLFYSTKGVTMSTVDNNTKLTLIYQYLNAEKKGVEEKINSTYFGSSVCQNNFVVDSSDSAGMTSTCTITKFDKNLFVETSKKLFNDTVLDTSVSFSPVTGKSCIVDGDNNLYLCGNVENTTNVTGTLESKFTILKVTKDEDGTINIYEKGYLLDNRSDKKALHPGYDNIYLHSTDSTDYYYELKNADNLTFVHVFELNATGDYYYVKTELVKE